VADVNERNLRAWIERGLFVVTGPRFAGRMMFSLADAVRVRVMASLVDRTGMLPGDAAKVAECFCRKVAALAPGWPDIGAGDSALAESVSPALALTLARVGGEWLVGAADERAPGYDRWQIEWGGQVHVVLPVASLLQAVIGGAIDVLAARGGVS
jgi:hypothetical protein